MMEITKLTRESRDALLENLAGRNAEDTRAQEEAARAIIADIRREGDEAAREKLIEVSTPELIQ